MPEHVFIIELCIHRTSGTFSQSKNTGRKSISNTYYFNHSNFGWECSTANKSTRKINSFSQLPSIRTEQKSHGNYETGFNHENLSFLGYLHGVPDSLACVGSPKIYSQASSSC